MTNDGTTPDATSNPEGPVSSVRDATSTDVLTTLDVSQAAVLRAAVVGALSYAIAWAASLVFVVLLIVLAFVEDDGSDVSWWWLLTAPGQVVAAAFRSPAVITTTSTGGELGSFGSSVSSSVSLLSLLAVILVAAYRLSRRDEVRTPSRSSTAAATLALVSAASFVALALLVAVVLKVSFGDGDAIARLGAAGFPLVAFGVAGVGIVGLLGRRPWSSWRAAASVPLAARAAWRAVVVHVAVFSALALPIGVVWIVVQGEAATLLALPAVVGNLLVWAITVGHLGGLSVSGIGELLDAAGSGSTTLWVFGEDSDKALWLLVLCAILGVLAAAVVLHERGRGSVRTTAHWVWAAVVYGVVAGALALLGTVSTGFGSTIGVGAMASFGPAPWFVLVFAAWGALAELLARLVGPRISAALPAAWVTRAVGQVGPMAPVDAAPAVEAGAPVGDEAATVATTSEPLDPRTKKVLVGVGSAAVLVVAAAVGVSVVSNVFLGPEKQVEEYFAALADGDVDRAVGLAQLDYSTDERVLLTDEILGDDGGPFTDVEIGDVQKQGDFATATVSYTVDGSEQSQDVTLRRSGSRFVFFDRWELVNPGLGTLYVTAEGATGLKVNGAAVDIAGLGDGVQLPVFPGDYDITPVSDSRYLTYESQATSVGTDSESLDFELAPSADLLAEATKQASAFLEGCIAKAEADPDGCPNETYGFDLEDVAWTLDEAPTYELETDYDGGWRVTTTDAGSASVTAKEPSFLDDEPARDYTDTVSIDLSGTVTIDGDTVTFEPADYY